MQSQMKKQTQNSKNSLADLQRLMIQQLKRRGFYPLKEADALLRLGEEVGEVFEAARERQPKKLLAREIADVLWMLLIFCDLKKIDLAPAFLEKLRHNARRPLPK